MVNVDNLMFLILLYFSGIYVKILLGALISDLLIFILILDALTTDTYIISK